MKANYNFDNLPKAWCINVITERDHPRLEEFKVVFNSIIKNKWVFSYTHYGIDENGPRAYSWPIPSPFEENYLISLDQFFELIEQPEIAIGDYLVCHTRMKYNCSDDTIEVGERFEIVSIANKTILIYRNGIPCFFPFHFYPKYFSIEKPAIPNGNFIRNDTVLVRDSENNEWQERIFIIEHDGLFYCAIETHAGLEPFRFIKPIEKPDALRPKLDEIIGEYAKLGIKLTPTFETIEK